MRSSPDPAVHQRNERRFIEHVERLLEDDRLRVDTTAGRYPVTSTMRDVNRDDRGVQLKRTMAELGRHDRELEAQMPAGQSIDVTLSLPRWIFFKKAVGRFKVVSLPPTRALLAGEPPQPLGPAEVKKALSEIPPPLSGVPSTIVLMSSSGFTINAHEAAERRVDRTVVLVEPNDAGGWTVHGPPETKALSDLFDPEVDDEKRQRIRNAIEQQKVELLAGGLSGERLANTTQLPMQLVEEELKSYAQRTPGLLAKRLNGRLVLFRHGTAPAAGKVVAGGSQMPFVERMKALFARKDDPEKQIEFLSERRAELTQQRDVSYEDLAALEKREAELREQFRSSDAELAKRRITSQLLQLRKDIQRRQQLLGVLNQQIEIVSTDLHNLELVKQGRGAKLPDSDKLAADAAAAEETLAQLQTDAETAAAAMATVHPGLNEEEQALYEELERETRGAPSAEATATPPAPEPRRQSTPPPIAAKPEPRRAEPEAG
jgi:hypothetical protein